MRTSRLVLIILCVLVVQSTVFAANSAFADRKASTPPESIRGREVLRVRPVTLRKSLFDKALGKGKVLKVEMNFFPNVLIRVEWKESRKLDDPSGLAWTGSVVEASGGTASLVYSKQGVTGNITRGDGKIYQIRTAADGIWVREINQLAFPNEGTSIRPVPK